MRYALPLHWIILFYEAIIATQKRMGRRRNDHRQLSFWTAPDEGFVAMAKGVKRIFHFRYK